MSVWHAVTKTIVKSSLYLLNVFPQTCNSFLYNSENVFAAVMGVSVVM